MKTFDRKIKHIPAKVGYHMPAEWEKHEATWLAWPHNIETWPTQLSEVEKIYIQMVRVLAKGEKVHILVDDLREEERAKNQLSKDHVEMSQVFFFRIPTADVWIRDYGPNFIVKNDPLKSEPAFNRWIFNAWGERYESLKADHAVPDRLLEFLDIPFFEPGIILEGGSIDANGEGTVLTTEQCLLNPNRNPHLKKQDIEGYLKDFLGVTHVIWLGEGIVGDDTDGHVDDIARFIASDTILCAVEEDKKDANYSFLQDNLKRLEKATDQSGRQLKIIELPMPGKVDCADGRLPASYANFYIGNSAVLVPLYNHPNDSTALEILGSCFPTRQIVGIPCGPLVCGLGAIHCVTQQQPA